MNPREHRLLMASIQLVVILGVLLAAWIIYTAALPAAPSWLTALLS